MHRLVRSTHLCAVFVTLEQLRWARIGTAASGVDNTAAGHKHALWRDGPGKRFVRVEVARKGDGDAAVVRIADRLCDLLCVKKDLFVCLSDGSHTYTLIKWIYDVLVGATLQYPSQLDQQFENFVWDEYRTLVEVDNQIFSASERLWTYREAVVRLPRDEGRLDFWEQHFDRNGAKEVHAWEDDKAGHPRRMIDDR